VVVDITRGPKDKPKMVKRSSPDTLKVIVVAIKLHTQHT